MLKRITISKQILITGILGWDIAMAGHIKQRFTLAFERISNSIRSCRWDRLKDAVVTTVIATLISTFLVSCISEHFRELREQTALIDSINGIYLGGNKDWVDSHLGPATFINEHDDFVECVYVSEIAAVRVFYDVKTNSCSAFFVTALNRQKSNKLGLPELYSYITDGKNLGEFSYYDIKDKPLGVYGYVSQGAARSFYMENYYYGAGNYYNYYFISMDYGVERKNTSFASMFELASTVSYIDDEVNISQNTNPYLLVISDRRKVYPNTYGMSFPGVTSRIRELISDYNGFDSRQIKTNP